MDRAKLIEELDSLPDIMEKLQSTLLKLDVELTEVVRERKDIEVKVANDVSVATTEVTVKGTGGKPDVTKTHKKFTNSDEKEFECMERFKKDEKYQHLCKNEKRIRELIAETRKDIEFKRNRFTAIQTIATLVAPEVQ